MSADQGRFCWYDLMTTDPGAAQAFYKKLVGWGTVTQEFGGQPYTMWTVGENPIGGVNALPEDARKAGAPPHWLAYVLTSDVDERLAKAKELGAKIKVPATDIPEVGRFGVFTDPQGALIAIYAPASESPGDASPAKLGEFSWHELATTNPESAFSFYQKLFGWEKTEAMDMGEAGMYQMYKQKGGEFPLGGIFKKPDEMPGPPAWLYYARVKDVHKGVETVKQLGGQILNGPMEVPGGDFIAQCLDPQGAAFAIHHTKG
ncbi:MAG TPA: VOC family protein [Vicinamibacteria bacterium]|nr:VOC family protein [Vicinamibacteria bacterium]